MMYCLFSVTSHINCIATCCLINMVYLYQVMMKLHFLNGIANDAELTQKSKNYVIIASLKNETIGKLINRIPGSCLLI